MTKYIKFEGIFIYNNKEFFATGYGKTYDQAWASAKANSFHTALNYFDKKELNSGGYYPFKSYEVHDIFNDPQNEVCFE